MFRQTLILTAIAIVSTFNVAFADQDDLFSEVDSTSVFSSAERGSGDAASAARRRIVSGDQLRDLLNSAGFEAKAISGSAASTKKRLAPWNFPVLAFISKDESRIRIVLGLSTIQDVSKELPAARLLSLMKLSESGPGYSYHSGRQRTEISSTLTNRGLTSDLLRDEVNRLAVAASQTSETWANEKQLSQNQSRPITQPTTSQSTAPQTTLAGRWSASRSATEAFAIDFQDGGKFALVFVAGQSQTRSEGSFQLTNESLELKGNDGLILKGQFSRLSPTSFTFQVNDGTTMTFQKAGQS